jgi:predicted enzyme related to lactoylglutathione lyase
VADAEEIAKKAVVNGGRVIMPPTQMPGVGKITGIEHNTAGRILAVEYERPFA